MDVCVILIFVTVFLLSCLVLVKPKGLPPGPLCFPVIGSFFFLRHLRQSRIHLALLEASNYYGSVFSFRLGSQQVIAINGYDAINEALVKQADVFSDRPNHLPAIDSILKDGGGLVFQTYGKKWKTLRRFTLLSLRDFGVGKTSIEEKILFEIEAASNIFKKTNEMPVDISAILQKIIANVMYGIIFGRRYDFDDAEFDIIRKMCDTLVSGQGISNPANFFPAWITRILARKANAEIVKRNNVMDEIKEYILKQIKDHEETIDENGIRDFVDLYVMSSRGNKTSANDEALSKGNILRVILELFIVGAETTSTVLCWAFLFLAEYPAVQRKCQLEIENLMGNKTVRYADREKLTYVNATLLEILRLSNVTPLGVPHCTNRDTVLMGHYIPKRTMVMTNIYSATMDPRYWQGPTNFNPDRFINCVGKLIINKALIPFSVGPRACLGEPLARIELFLVITKLLQRFTVTKSDPGIKYSMDSKPNQVTRAPLPYKVIFKER